MESEEELGPSILGFMIVSPPSTIIIQTTMTDLVESPSHLTFVLKVDYFWRLPALERTERKTMRRYKRSIVMRTPTSSLGRLLTISSAQGQFAGSGLCVASRQTDTLLSPSMFSRHVLSGDVMNARSFKHARIWCS